MSKICQNCNSILSENHNFCTKCGTKIVDKLEKKIVFNDNKNNLSQKENIRKYKIGGFLILIALALFFVFDKSNNTSPQKEMIQNNSKSIDNSNLTKVDIDNIVLNLFDAKGNEKLMKLSFSLISSEPTIITIVETYKAEIIDVVISQVTARSSDELLTVDGKKLLKDELMQDINNVINEAAASNSIIAKNNIKSIIFTTFIIK